MYDPEGQETQGVAGLRSAAIVSDYNINKLPKSVVPAGHGMHDPTLAAAA